MNKKTAIAMLGVVGLSLLLAGCTGLLQHSAPIEAVPIAPSDPKAVRSIDPRLLGEGLIQEGAEYADDRIIVGYLSNKIGEQALQKVLALVGGQIVASVELGEIVIVEIELGGNLDVPEALGMVMLLVTGQLGERPVEGLPAEKGESSRTSPNLERQRLEGIVFAEPDYIIEPPEPILEPIDLKGALEPEVYDPNADLRPFQWALDAVNADAAWATGYTGKDIVVAVIDTGVDSTHPDLVGQVVRRYDPELDMEMDSSIDYDSYGHGTHCAGIIAAKNDGKGVVGLAYNAKIMDVRIFNPDFVGTVQCAGGIKWAVDNGAQVLSNSWGGWVYNQAIKAACDYALANGVVVVAAAGNDTYATWTNPASYAGVIAVAATTPHNRKANFSTPGTWLSVSAPGTRVLSSVRSQETQEGTGLPLLYSYWSGTSMACPHVAALAAMILEKFPTATPYQVKNLIERTAKDIEAAGFDTGTGHGLIQADKAVTTSLPANTGAALRINVVTESSMSLWGQWWPLPYMDVTLRKGGRIINRGQTDLLGRVYLGFPQGDYDWWLSNTGLAYFPVLEPGTYEVVVGGDDCVAWGWYRTANRVTGRATVTLTPGGVHTVDVKVNTTLEVTLTWIGGAADTDIDLAVWEPGAGWTFAWNPGFWGSWTPDQSGPSGTETYTLYAPGAGPFGGHYDDEFYDLAVVFNGGAPATVTVTVKQNGVTENYTFDLTTPGWYYAYTAGPPESRWPNWWNDYPGPYVF
ncbi:MAG TPA: hypothetical protein ENN53_02125 [Candidatus Acetothermia bacterium]|nr:hypothetical protein [Candidatus Acetothermia bacterium]